MKKNHLFVLIFYFVIAENFGQCPNPPSNYPTVNFSFITQIDARLTIIPNNSLVADGYLVVQSTNPNLGLTPINGTPYIFGNAFGTGIVISNNNATTINLTGLSTGTNYYYFVYPYYNCSISPTYKSLNVSAILLRTNGLPCTTEDFESMTLEVPSPSSSLTQNGWTFYSNKVYVDNNISLSGNQSAHIAGSNNPRIVLPSIDNPTEIEFWVNPKSTGDNEAVYFSIWDGSNWNPINTLAYSEEITGSNLTPGVWKRFVIDLTILNLPFGSPLISFDTANAWDINFDDFKIYCIGNDVDCPPKVIWDNLDSTVPKWWQTDEFGVLLDPLTLLNTGVPQSNISVILNKNYDTATFGDFEACSVTVNPNITFNINGSSSFNQNNYISIVKELRVKDGATLNIEDGNSLIMINNGSTVTIEGTGIINTKRTTKLQNDWNFTYWSSPVIDDTNSSTISEVFFNNPIYPSSMDLYKIFKYDPAKFNDLYNNLAGGGTSGLPDGLDDDAPYTAEWVWQKPSETKMIPGVGYIVNSYPGGQLAKTYTFSGEINNGIITVPIYSSANPNVVANYLTDYDDWNLIGNPYPSALITSAFLSDPRNIGIIGGTVLLWTQTNVIASSNTGYANYHNFNNGDYSYYNISGYLPADINATEVSDLYIASGQSFIVEGLDNDGTTALTPKSKIGDVTFSNSMRYGSYVSDYKIFPPFDNTVFYKPSKTSKKVTMTEDKSNKIWLSLSETQGAFSQTLISFFDYDASKMENATDGVDRAYDALKYLSGNYVDIYSLIDEQPFAIQGRTPLTDDVVIPLGYNTNITGTLKIGIKNRLGAISGKDIFLEDKLFPNQPSHNLSLSPYEFDATETMSNNNRFNLRFTDITLLVDTVVVPKKDKVIVYSSNNLLMVESTYYDMKKIIIYDLLGRKLLEVKPNKKEYEFSIDQINKGSVVIVKTFLGNQTINTNKIIVF